MKLNVDCVRDILFTVEEYANERGLYIDSRQYQKYENLKKYDYSIISYHIEQCEKNGLFDEYARYMRQEYHIKNLSPKGHAFIQNIRENSLWNKIKDKMIKGGELTVAVLIDVAKEVFTKNL